MKLDKMPSAKKAEKLLNAPKNEKIRSQVKDLIKQYEQQYVNAPLNSWGSQKSNVSQMSQSYDTQISYDQLTKMTYTQIQNSTLRLEDVLSEYQSFEDIVKEVIKNHGNNI